MNIPVWALIVVPIVFAFLGFLVCAMCMVSSSADEQFSRWEAEAERDGAMKAHARCADALSTTQRKLSAIRDLINKPETVRKGRLSEILDGDAL